LIKVIQIKLLEELQWIR